ncbi:serine dehydratase subunit alpha family protein [Kosmotoga olearia]|uniref:UPF0597 protein Kole_0595 n=2 Tax=Kosmotoga TaxID=651456 RepID=Y595_KOSOT|nr:L-serine ammonia-lyase, iron-sulfur-dependent, subunit alpha [Kosmotoga olearia]C5CEY4.1 RecName: Full=UPF0597 protein Kole_0595 [Kosmotoga olearia TBF 19.5.1]ACR79313.1 protein of unknown function DUF1063 [Kosmotoga olearia TBF 19.5.1]
MIRLTQYLQSGVKPALGCTEPGAIAFAVSRACKDLPEDEILESIEVKTSINIYKNGMYVVIPGTNGARGNKIAAALGAICGDPSLKLRALKSCNDSHIEKAKRMIASGKVKLSCLRDKPGVYIDVTVKTRNHAARCVIDGDHTAISLVARDGVIVFKGSQREREEPVFFEGEKFPIDEIIETVERIDAKDVDFIFEGVKMNLEIATYAMNEGISLCKPVKENNNSEEELAIRIKRFCAAASFARMAGVPLPVMSSGGSGNQGIVTILPVAITGKSYGKTREEIAKAIALSHLVLGYIKSRLGKVTPTCGAANAAGPAAAAGIVYMLNGSTEQISQAMSTVFSSTLGMICDGAKEACAYKVGFSGEVAYNSAMLALDKSCVAGPQGVVGKTIEETIENIREISTRTALELENTIIDILEKYNK